MNLSIFVHEEVYVRDVVSHFTMATVLVLTAINHFTSEEVFVKKTEEILVDNNSPPVFAETLGISIQEVVKTKEALS